MKILRWTDDPSRLRTVGWVIVLALLAPPACSKEPTSPTRTPPADRLMLKQQRAKQPLVQLTHRAMGTRIRIGIWRPLDRQRALAVIRQGFAEFDRLEKLMSSWRPGSEIGRLNRLAGKKSVRLSPETLLVLQKGLFASRQTSGLFDITFRPLAGLWQIKRGPHPPPGIEAIKGALKLVDYRKLSLDADKRIAFLPTTGMLVDLGGIAKGYAVDRVVALLRRHFTNFFVHAGGDLYFAGQKGDKPWRAGIQDPRGPRGSFFASVSLRDRTCSTSGDYERFFIYGGKRYHHIIDPRTGTPATESRSVTIIAKSAVQADTLSTGVFILGPTRGIKLIESLTDVEGLIVDRDNKLHISSGLKRDLSVLRRPTP